MIVKKRRHLVKAQHRAGGESGATLIEFVVALGIISMISVTFLVGLSASARSAIIADDQTTASSLARSQMEYLKRVPYISGSANYTPDAYPSYGDYADYSVNITAQPLRVPDDGIQKITVSIKHFSKKVFQLEGYKVDR